MKPAYIIEAPDVLKIEVTVNKEALPQQPITGAYLVRPDGTVSLGVWGNVAVAGLTIPEATEAVRAVVMKHVVVQGRESKSDDVLVSLEVASFNSKRYYVIVLGKNGDEVQAFPCTGNETVLDALAGLKGANALLGGAEIRIERDGKSLMVDWNGIVQNGDTKTNYQIEPGDRLFVKPKK